MKKKVIISVIAVIAVIACVLVFSGKETPQEPETTEAAAVGQPLTVNFDEDTEKNTGETKKFNKKVKVVLPIDFVDKKYSDDLDAFAEAMGYSSIKKISDTHVEVKMREFSYKMILTNKGMETMDGIGSALDSGNYPFFTKLLKYSDDFSQIVIGVNKEEFEKAENKDELYSLIALYSLYYQEYVSESPKKCTVMVCEEGDNVVLESKELTKEDIE